ncbi:hypothetical protein [Brevibacillus brevis]|uniref:Uncharacterized protein n=1 Tax=Brevibacillus brevis TaxID=1393 RepID=A0ABY9T3D7_BREBE|nr:hypothetical protein [Brevibacillus brevis]WNC14596.1 hypothetical protein RGB73_28705 [Brevibacillus brevis]
MIRLGWKHRLHAFFAGRLLGCEYLADEGFVTQLLEMGQHSAVADFDQSVNELWICR